MYLQMFMKLCTKMSFQIPYKMPMTNLRQPFQAFLRGQRSPQIKTLPLINFATTSDDETQHKDTLQHAPDNG